VTDISLLERVAASSPVIVLVLMGACVALWRTLREEVASCRSLHVRSIESQTQLATAIDRLSERIEARGR
jgi:hypothetical protein